VRIVDCPYCNQPGAQRSLFKTRCPNPACVAYDPELRGGLATHAAPSVHQDGPRDAGAAPPKPGELLPHAGTTKKTVRIKAGGSGCGWSIFLWVIAYIAFRNALKHGGKMWIVTAILAVLAWQVGKFSARAASRPARRGEGRAEPSPEITYEEPFDAGGANAIEVRYRNWKGETKTFIGDRRTMRRRGRHLTLRVAPEGVRVALALDRIQNLPEVEAAAPR